MILPSLHLLFGYVIEQDADSLGDLLSHGVFLAGQVALGCKRLRCNTDD
jgi:hypothetical protein